MSYDSYLRYLINTTVQLLPSGLYQVVYTHTKSYVLLPSGMYCFSAMASHILAVRTVLCRTC